MDRTCVDGQCLDPCYHESPCAATAQCTGNKHEAQCKCPTGTTGNPFENCSAVGCKVNQDCPYALACSGGTCKNPCENNGKCSEKSCFVENHDPVCPCSFIKTEHASNHCQSSVVSACLSDKDCGRGTLCHRGQCVDPCDPNTDGYNCARNAICTLTDTLPFKSVTCTCPLGFSGDVHSQCLESMSSVFHKFCLLLSLSQTKP